MNEERKTKNEEPLVSVCIGTYNRERYIRECLDSVFSQTYSNLEVIVVDDASTDGTVEILREYGERIRLVLRETNSGMCPVTRNQAIRAASGAYIALLDSDDAWCPGKIEQQVAFMEAHPNIPLCHTYCYILDEHSNIIGIRHEGVLPPTGNCFRDLLRHCWITNSSVLFRRSLYDEIGPFNEDDRYGIWGEDLEYFLRVSKDHDIGLVNEVLAKYRKSAANISAGNWRHTPESLPLHRMILDRPDIWKEKVSRQEVIEAFRINCVENAVYWRDRRKPAYSLWTIGQGLRVAPLSIPLWSEAVKTLGRAVWPRRGARR